MARAPKPREIVEDEPLPEADCLPGMPHPRHTRRLIGQQAAERTVLDAFGSGRMHHGWLLTGPAGVGKATLAYGLARYLLARPHERRPGSLEVPPESSAARQVGALSHPGLLLIRRTCDPKTRRFSQTIPVDEVRRLKTFLGQTAEAGSWRVVVVDAADEMNASAANALLKSLEEPPPRGLFLLISSEPGRLLPTIRSRCRTLELPPLAPDAVRQAATAALGAAEATPPADADWPKLLRLAEGSVRKLLFLTQTGGLELHEQAFRLLSLLPKVDWPAVHALGEDLTSAQAGDRFETFYALLLDLLARLIRAGTGVADAANADELQLAQRLMRPAALASWAALWETIVREKAKALAINLDRKSLILETVIRLQELARAQA